MCPEKNQKEYKELVELFGEDGALAAWKLAGEKTPDRETAMRLMHNNAVIESSLRAWDTGSYSGKVQKTYEPIIDELIKKDPDAKVGGGESFNQVKHRGLRAATSIMNDAPYGSVIVTSSSVLKFILLWDQMGRPTDWSKITPQEYLKESTKPGQDIKINGTHGQKLTWIRHGETDENKDKVLRTPDALLVDEGKKDADTVGEKLSKEPIPVAYISPTPRTLQTADRILMKQPMEARIVQQNINYQLDHYKQITKQFKDGARKAVEEGRNSSDNIGKAYRILKGSDSKTSEGDRRMVQESGKDWTNIQRGRLSYPEEDIRRRLELTAEGTEHEVYQDGDKMIKINKVSSDDIPKYLDRLMLHNHMFPSTSYKLLGFINRNGKTLPVVEQRRVKDDGRKFDPQRVGMRLFTRYGMVPVKEGAGDHYVNPESGISLLDINPMNVLTEEGELQFIDPIIEVNMSKLMETETNINKQLYGRKDEMGNIQSSSKEYTGDSNRLSTLSREEEKRRSIIRGSNRSREESRGDTGITENGRTGRHRPDTITDNSRSSGRTDRVLQTTVNKLNRQVEQFLKSVGANVEHIKDTGQNFTALADTINGVIQVVEGKAGIDTLPHEATHLFLDLLPDNSKLLKEIIKDVQNRIEYDEVYEQYKDDPQYQKDGVPDEEKIAKETAVHIIDDLIVGKFRDGKAAGWCKRLWEWIKGLFKGKSLDNYEQVAEDILDNETGKLSKEKMRKMQEASDRGEVYYQLDPQRESYVKKMREQGTLTQKAIIDATILKPDTYSKEIQEELDRLGIIPAERVILDESTHTYLGQKSGKPYTSTTRAINGEFDPEKQSLYAPNRDAGNDADKILESIILGKPIDSNSLLMIRNPQVQVILEHDLQNIVDKLRGDGMTLFPQVTTSDLETGLAGTKDIQGLFSNGDAAILDLKTSVRKVYDKNGIENKELSKTYTSVHTQNLGSVFNDFTRFKDTKGIYRVQPREKGQEPIKLSKELQHYLQVHAYGKMDDKQGLPTSKYYTIHFQVDLQQDEQGNLYAKDYRYEDTRDISQERNVEYLECLIPGKIDEKDWSKLQHDIYDVVGKGEPQVVQPLTEEEQKVVDKQLSVSLESIKTELSRRQASALDNMRETSLNIIKNTIADISNLQEKGELQKATTVALNYVSDITNESLKFISNKDNFKHLQYYQYLTESILIASSNDELLPPRLRKHLTDDQKTRFDYIKENISTLEELSNIRQKEYLLQTVSPPDGTVDIVALEQTWFPKEGIRDISLTGSWATNYDALRVIHLRKAQNIVQQADIKAGIADNKIEEKWIRLGNDIAQLAGSAINKPDEFYKFMYNLGPDGKVISYLNPIGDNYYETAADLQKPLIDSQGNWKKFIPVYTKEDATPEQLQYNIDLWYDKLPYREFKEAERLDETGKVVEGKYHHLSEEFIQERDKIMKKVVHTNFYGEPTFFEYVPKDGMTEETPSVKSFLNKYMVRDRCDIMQKGKDKKPTGVVEQTELWFPNKRYIRINQYTDNKPSGTDLRNPRHTILKEDQTPLGKVKWNFYQEFIKDFAQGANDMAGEAQTQVDNLSLIQLSSTLLHEAAKTGTLATIKRNGEKLYTVVHRSNIEKTNADGITRNTFRIPLIGSLKSKQRITDIQKKIGDLIAQKSTLGKTAFRKRLDELHSELNREQHKLTVDQLDLDPVHQITAWRIGANAYRYRKDVEGQIMVLQWGLKQQKFIKTTGLGIEKKDPAGNPVFKHEDEVNAFRAMNQFGKNFYGVTLDETKLGAMVKRIQNYTSFCVMGLNALNGINNTFLYQINLAGQSLSGRYGLSMKNWAKGTKEVMTDYVPGLVKKQFDKALHYGNKRPHSYLESFVREYRLIVDNVKREGGFKGLLGKTYVFEKNAVDLAQVNLIAGAIRDFSIPNHDTGTMVPIRDAHSYDDNTGKIILLPGFDQKDVVAQMVRIADIQTQSQGNYQQISQPAMAGTLLGSISLQFRRMFATTWNNRFAEHIPHETLGDTEGSWRSVPSLIQLLKEHIEDPKNHWSDPFNPFDKEKREEFWKNTPDYIKHNLAFDALDLVRLAVLFTMGAILHSLAEEVDDDDPNMKRWMNYMAYTASKLRFEQQMFNPVLGWVQMAEFAQNPVAMTNTVKGLAEVLYLSAEFPFQSEDERTYQNGVLKGRSKLGYKLEANTVIIRQHARWINLIKAQTQEGTVLGSSAR